MLVLLRDVVLLDIALDGCQPREKGFEDDEAAL